MKKDIVAMVAVLRRIRASRRQGALSIGVLTQSASTCGIYFLQFMKNMLNAFDDVGDTDVTFTVGDSLILAHELILGINAKVLACLCEGAGKSPIMIAQTKACVFRSHFK